MNKLTRRELIKAGIATGSVVAAGQAANVLAQEAIQGGRSVSRTTGTPRFPVASACGMCSARCGIIGYLEDNILVKIEGNPRDPNNRGRLCARGLAGIQALYNPDRLAFPLKRTGRRGEDKWQRLTWDQAYAELAERLKAWQGTRPEALVILSGIDELLVGRFARAYGTPHLFTSAALTRANKETALKLVMGASPDINHLAHAKYILNFGANPYETGAYHVPLVQRLIDGRMRGAKLVTFDPRTSNTAGKSDEWFPIRPGTDGLVALAMANVIVQLGLYDRDFVENWMNVPLPQLAAHLAQYTLEGAEAASGVKGAHIRRIALEFATTHPATTISGGGASQHANGVQTERAIALLNALTGNIDVRGGYCLPRTYSLAEPAPLPPEPKVKNALLDGKTSALAAYAPTQQVFPAIRDGRLKCGILMTYGHNAAYTHPDTNLVTSVLKDEQLVPFHVAVDTFLTETAALADIVLPAATYLESWGIYSVPAYDLVPFVGLQQPIVKPQAEAVPFHNIAIELATRVGGGMEKYFSFGTMEDYVKTAISRIEGLQRAGGLDYLKEYGVWLDPVAEPEYRTYEKEGFNTPSGQFEVYNAQLEEAGLPALPTYVPVPGLTEFYEEEFVLITYMPGVQASDLAAPATWLSEITHDNAVWINKEVAEFMRIRKGDLVTVISPLGRITLKVHVTQGIDPHVVAISGGVGHWGMGRIAQAEKFKSRDGNTNLIWWGEKHGRGVHPYPLIPIAADPIGGGQAWLDTKVTIERVRQ